MVYGFYTMGCDVIVTRRSRVASMYTTHGIKAIYHNPRVWYCFYTTGCTINNFIAQNTCYLGQFTLSGLRFAFKRRIISNLLFGMSPYILPRFSARSVLRFYFPATGLTFLRFPQANGGMSQVDSDETSLCHSARLGGLGQRSTCLPLLLVPSAPIK